MKNISFLVLGLVLLGAACNRQEQNMQIPYSEGLVNIAGRTLSVDFAETNDEQTTGLSNRESLEDNQGMLFLFNVPDFPVFWMKDMNFPIDIIWIKGDEIVDISAGAQPEPGVPENNLKTYTPKKPADRVLEVQAGWASRNDLKIGDRIEIIRTILPPSAN